MRSLITLLFAALLLTVPAFADPTESPKPVVCDVLAPDAEPASPIALPVLPKWKGKTREEVRALHAAGYPTVAQEVSLTPADDLRFDGLLDGMRVAMVYRFHETKLSDIEFFYLLEPDQKGALLVTIDEEWSLLFDMSPSLREDLELTRLADPSMAENPFELQQVAMYKTTDDYYIFTLQRNEKADVYIASFRAT